MNRILKSLSITALLLAAGTAASSAHAGSHNIGAFAGRAQQFSQSSSFGESYDGITNTSSTNGLRWDIPLSVDSSEGYGGYEVFVHGNVSLPSANLSCRAVGQDAFGGSWSGSPLVYAATSGNVTLALPSEVVGGSSGILYTACWLDAGVTIYSYNW